MPPPPPKAKSLPAQRARDAAPKHPIGTLTKIKGASSATASTPGIERTPLGTKRPCTSSMLLYRCGRKPASKTTSLKRHAHRRYLAATLQYNTNHNNCSWGGVRRRLHGS